MRNFLALFFGLVAGTVLFVALAKCQNTPTTPHPKNPSLTDFQKDKLRAKYSRALLFQNEVQRLQERLNAATSDYNAASKEVASEAGFPEGTNFQINVTTEEVVPILPPPPKNDGEKK